MPTDRGPVPRLRSSAKSRTRLADPPIAAASPSPHGPPVDGPPSTGLTAPPIGRGSGPADCRGSPLSRCPTSCRGRNARTRVRAITTSRRRRERRQGPARTLPLGPADDERQLEPPAPMAGHGGDHTTSRRCRRRRSRGRGRGTRRRRARARPRRPDLYGPRLVFGRAAESYPQQLVLPSVATTREPRRACRRHVRQQRSCTHDGSGQLPGATQR